MTGMFREPGFNCAPWVFSHLFDRKAHFAGFLIKGHHFSFVLVVKFKEFFCIDWRVGPGDFTYVNQTFNTRHDFEEGAIVFDVHHFTFHDFTFFEVFGQGIPGMRSKLFQAKADTFFIIIEIEYNNIEFLIHLQYF